MSDPMREQRRTQKKVLREARVQQKRETRRRRRERILEINQALKGRYSQENFEEGRMGS